VGRRRLGRGRLLAFSVGVLVLGLGLAELAAGAWIGDRPKVGLTRADFFLFARQPLLVPHESGLQVSDYALTNSAWDTVAADRSWQAVVLGGSFAAGDPWVVPGEPRQPGGLAGFVEGRIEAPVLSLAANGDTSIRVREKVPEVLALKPDLLVVATGNNEFPLDPPAWVHRLRRSELGRLLRWKLPLDGLEPPSDLDALRLAGPPSATLRAIFDRNLATIRRRAEAAGVPLLLATLPNNLLIDLATPTAFDSPDAACAAALVQAEPGSAAQLWLDGIAAGTGGCLGEATGRYASDPDGALEAARACAEFPAAGAAGLALHWLGSPAGRTVLQLRIEADTQGVRPSFNRVVQAAGASVLDLNAAAALLDPDGLPGPGLFVDCCHLDWAGYADLAEPLAAATGRPLTGPAPRDQGASAGLPPPYPQTPRSRPAPGTCPPIVPL